MVSFRNMKSKINSRSSTLKRKCFLDCTYKPSYIHYIFIEPHWKTMRLSSSAYVQTHHFVPVGYPTLNVQLLDQYFNCLCPNDITRKGMYVYQRLCYFLTVCVECYNGRRRYTHPRHSEKCVSSCEKCEFSYVSKTLRYAQILRQKTLYTYAYIRILIMYTQCTCYPTLESF